MWDLPGPELLLQVQQVRLVDGGKYHGVGVRREIPGGRVSSGVYELGAETASREILTDHNEVGQGRFGDLRPIGGDAARVGKGGVMVERSAWAKSSGPGGLCQETGSVAP